MTRPTQGSWIPAAMLMTAGAAALTLSILVVGTDERAPLRPAATRSTGRFAETNLPFIANRGQVDGRVAYYARTFGGTVFVTRSGRLVYGLPAISDAAAPVTGPRVSAGSPRGWSLTESFVGGVARPAGADTAVAKVSYFVGDDPGRWRTGIPAPTQIKLGKVWPGVGVHLRVHGRSVEKIFTVEPGAAVSAIRMRIGGARQVELAADGSLALATGLGRVTLTAPMAWQEKDGGRMTVPVAYALHAGEYGFTLGAHDPALPVVIDPVLQSTYAGGSDVDRAHTMIIHPVSGEVYVAGRTQSLDFPGTTGGAQPATGGPVAAPYDAFVVRLSADLTTILQATYLGGTGSDEARAIVIHPLTNDVYLTGLTDSTDFPGTTGGAQATNGGGLDAFATHLDSSLATLIQSTYLGGANNDTGNALAVHPVSGDVYVAGQTGSTNFPNTTGGAQPAPSNFAGNDAFIVRLNANLSTSLQATYLGGADAEQVSNGLAVHPVSGEVYLAGTTQSLDFPGTTGGAQPATGGGFNDTFVARLDAGLTALLQATYLGGSDQDQSATGFSIDDGYGRKLLIHPASGDIYVTGNTLSIDFPGTTGGAQPVNGGGADVYIARLNAALTALVQSTYLGSFNADVGNGLAIHPVTGELYVAGWTALSGLPGTAGGAQPVFGGGNYDAFAARLSADLAVLNQATYLGGSGNDIGLDMALRPVTGEVYVAGYTPSTDFPATIGGAQPAIGGGTDAFVSRLSADLQSIPSSADLAVAVADAPDPLFVGATITYTVTVGNNGPAGATGVVLTDTLPAGVSLVSAVASQGACSGTTTISCVLGGLANAANATVTVVVTANVAGVLSNSVSVTAVETDPAVANNSASTTTTVNAATTADLALVLAAAPDPVGVNATLTYTHTITNNGPLAATNVVLTHTLPASGYAFGVVTPSQGSCNGTVIVSCNLGVIASGGSATVVVTVIPATVGTLASNASVVATEPDPGAANNGAASNVPVLQTVCSQGVAARVRPLVAWATGAESAAGSAECTATVGGAQGGGGSADPLGLAALACLALVQRFGRRRGRRAAA